jgi:hypothetical protein
MTYTIAVKPSPTPGKVTATSSDGHSFTTATPLLDGARYWQSLGADPAATILTTWSTGAAPFCLYSTIGHAASKTVHEGQHQPPHFTNWKPYPIN